MYISCHYIRDEFETDIKKIRYDYFTKRFILDLIAVFPADYICYWIIDPPSASIIRVSYRKLINIC